MKSKANMPLDSVWILKNILRKAVVEGQVSKQVIDENPY